MGQYHLKLPKMGEGVAEATVTKWILKVGDTIRLDDPIVEIATDKVDTDVTSEVEGVLAEKCFQENEVVQVGETLLIIETEGELANEEQPTVLPDEVIEEKEPQAEEKIEVPAVEENIDLLEQDMVKDILAYIENHSKASIAEPILNPTTTPKPSAAVSSAMTGSDQFREMTRMEGLISDHMMSSLKTSAHVQSFIEVDVSRLWDWREEVKNGFLARENEKLTFTPLFMSAIIKALRDYPDINSSIEGTKIITKQAINLGMATALPDGNLIVPVIKNADHLNLVGLAKAVNDLAKRARAGQLNPEEVKGGTYTFTNIGQFGSLMGTPIINQPQVGILAIGAIRKIPAVIETPKGDFIGIRRKMILSHSYDHRIINGATGGLFVKRVAEYLENWSETLPY